MEIIAIIQARMASTRLPGKVLMEVMDRPLLSYQIERLRLSKRIDDIIIATTTNKEDGLIVELARKEGIECYQGSEHDVLDRYYKAAVKYNIQHIMRITADCPLIEPGVCDQVAISYFESGVDYISTGPSFAEGLDCEIFSFQTLQRSWLEAKLKSEHEHVTLYIFNHIELFKSITLENQTDDSKYRITVDEVEDFIVVKSILEKLYREKNSYFTISEIKSFLDTNPEVYKLNAHLIRNEGLLKSLKTDRKYNPEKQ